MGGAAIAFTRQMVFARIHFRLNNASFADVAQLVEQLIRNQQVTGSSPVVGSSEFSKLEISPEMKKVRGYPKRWIRGIKRGAVSSRKEKKFYDRKSAETQK